MQYKDWPNAGAFNALGDQRTKSSLKIFGHFPDYASGVLYRTGPGGYKIPQAGPKQQTFAMAHWFDGFSTVHRFELVAGESHCSEVKYSSYCHLDDAIDHVRKTGKLEGGGVTFGQKRDPCDSFYKKLKTVFEPNFDSNPRTANIGVVLRPVMPSELPKVDGIQDRRDSAQSNTGSERNLLATTTDSVSAKTFDADSLEPLGVTRQDVLHPALKGQLSGAHASVDPHTGEMFNFNLHLGPVPTYRVFRANPKTGKVDILAEISGAGLKAAYIHSMFLTENYVVLCVWCSFFWRNGAGILWNKNILDSMPAFDPQSKATWLVIDRHHGKGLVKRFTSPAFFCFHTTNAWELPSTSDPGSTDIVCELFEFADLGILHRLYYQNLVSDEVNVTAFNKTWKHNGSLTQYKLPRVSSTPNKKKAAEAERILAIPGSDSGDLQSCNPAYRMKRHRYVWAVRDGGKSSFVDSVVKTDTETKTSIIWCEERHTPSEPIFIAAPDAQAEDEGVVLVVVFNGETGTSYLLCLNAATLEEMGRAEVGAAVGMGFHGSHVPAAL